LPTFAKTTAKDHLDRADLLDDPLAQFQRWFDQAAGSRGGRLLKSSKFYIRDSGSLRAPLGLKDTPELNIHPKMGASWEGFAIEQIIQRHSGMPYFWSTYAQAELDLYFQEGNRRVGYEIKYTSQPTVTVSMRTAIAELKLDELYVVTPKDGDYALAEGIKVIGVQP